MEDGTVFEYDNGYVDRAFYNEIPYEGIVYPEDFYEWNFTKELGFQIEDSLISCMWYFNGDSPNGVDGTACKKTSFVRGMTQDKLPAACYTIESHIGEANYTVETLNYDSTLIMTLKWVQNDIKNPQMGPSSYVLSFHHPGVKVNPFDENLEVMVNQYYKVEVREESISRLPPPYATYCVDYSMEWMKNGGNGPLNKDECIQMCDIASHLERFGCISRDVSFPHEEKICAVPPSIDSETRMKIRKCMAECADACSEVKYLAKAEILSQYTYLEAKNKYGSPFIVSLEIHFQILDSIMRLHKPKYESVELFSYIGGYLGMWLGWSLVALMDFFGTIIRLCQYPLMKRKKKQVASKPFNFNPYNYHYY